MDLLLASATLALVAVMIPCLLFWRRFAQQPIRRARETIAGVNSSVQENIAGIRVVQSLNRQQQNITGFQSVNRENLDASLKSARYRYGLWPSVELLKALAIAMIVFVGGRMIGVSQEVGLLVAFALYAERLFDPIRDLTGDFGHLTGSLVAADRVFELLDVRPEVASAPGAVALPPVAGRVRYEKVSFHYDPESPVLRGIDLDVEPGETVALVGPTGAGKTTFVSLLMRLYDVTEGSVSIDGYDLRALRPDSLSRQIAMVPQEPFLFSATVSENIRHNRTELTDAEVARAAKAVGAHEFIMRASEGRLRYRAGGARGQPERRPEAAHQLRPGARARPEGADPRRGDGERRHRDGAAHPAGPRGAAAGPHLLRDRPPPLHGAQRRPHPGHGRRPHRRAGQARRAAREQGALPPPPRAVGLHASNVSALPSSRCQVSPIRAVVFHLRG